MAWLSPLFLALLLRLTPLRFSLPHTFYMDEPTVLNRSLAFSTGDLNPHFFFYPSLYLYALALASALTYALSRATGHVSSPADFAFHYFTDPTPLYLAARFTTAVFGAATVLVTYHVARRYFGPRAAPVAALALAVSVLHGSYSHVTVVDIPHAFFIAAAHLPIHAILRRSRPRDYVAAGLLIGLGAATKYLAILLVPALLLAHLLRDARPISPAPRAPRALRDLLSPPLALGLAAVALGFFLGSPYNLLDASAFLRDARHQLALSQGGEGHGVAFFLFHVLPADLGLPLCLAALVGLGAAVTARDRAQLVFLCFPVLYFAVVASFGTVYARYMLAEDPSLAVLAGSGVALVAHRLGRRVGARASALVLPAVAALACAFPARTLVRWDTLIARDEDPRLAAAAWAEANLPGGAGVALRSDERNFYNVPLQTDVTLARVAAQMPSGARFAPLRARVLEALRARPVFRRVPWSTDTEALEQQGVRAVFLSSFEGEPEPGFLAALAARSAPPVTFAPAPAWQSIPAQDGVVPVSPPTITLYVLRSPP